MAKKKYPYRVVTRSAGSAIYHGDVKLCNTTSKDNAFHIVRCLNHHAQGRAAVAALKKLADRWGEHFENDEHGVNGGDLVEWVGNWFAEVFAIVQPGKTVSRG